MPSRSSLVRWMAIARSWSPEVEPALVAEPLELVDHRERVARSPQPVSGLTAPASA